jgi:hypothetical protein
MATPAPATFAHLLQLAVNEPGVLSNAYRLFHGYSIGNQLLALSQCLARGIQPGPIATFPRWKELGRYVRKGERALVLCRPVTVKRTTQAADGTEETQPATFFVFAARWFVLSQTDGQRAVAEPPIPSWDAQRALTALDVAEVPFDFTDGNLTDLVRSLGQPVLLLVVAPRPPAPLSPGNDGRRGHRRASLPSTRAADARA